MKQGRVLEFFGGVARVGNRILYMVNNIILIVVMLFGLYALWDTWAIFKGAGVSDSLLAYKPELNYAMEENPTIQELVALYPDVRAWLTLEDTSIDYPVVQGEDNSTYVNLSVEGAFSLSGSIFLDCQNAGDFSDLYSIIYGHHMDLETMFGGLDLYKDEEYLNSHTTGYLFLPDTTYELEVFAIIYVDAYDTKIFTVNATDEEEQQERIDYIEENASVYRDIGISSSDRIVALSTCTSAITNGRTVVMARVTEIQ